MIPESRPHSKSAETGRLRQRRLGLILDQVIHEYEGRFSTDEAFIRFVEHVSKSLFDRIQFCSRVRPASDDAPYSLDPSIFEIVALPWYDNMRSLCLKSPVLFPRIARVLTQAMRHWEMVILGNVNPLAPLALHMAQRRGLPAILWVRGSHHADLNHRLGRRSLQRVVGTAVAAATVRMIPSGTHIITSGHNEYPFLARMGPVHVVYSSKFGLEDFVTLPRRRQLCTRKPRLLYVGRIAPEKGLEVLLDALRLARQGRGPMLPVLTLVGSDLFGSTYGDDFRRRLQASDLADHVEMVGYIPYGNHLFRIYDEHDVLILPSFTEGFPQVLLEAMARGLPVVSTTVGGVPKVIRDGENGLLVPPGDPESLAAALHRLHTDSELRTRISRVGQQTARSFAREEQVATVERFIRQSFPGLT